MDRRSVAADNPPPSPWRRWMLWGIVLLATILVIAFSLFVSELMRTVEDQDRQLMAVHRRLVELTDELRKKEDILGVLNASAVEVRVMKGRANLPDASGKVLWDPESGTAILQVSHLPPSPDAMEYQLWVFRGREALNAGVFSVRDTTPASYRMEDLPVTDPRAVAGFSVTLEPAGGSPRPTGTTYIATHPHLLN